MAYSSNNTIKTNELVELVALRAALVAPYFLCGSKAYFSNQIADKRSGIEYGFVLRDAGNVANTVAMDSTKNTIVEKTVKLKLEPWNIGVKTNAIEGITDIHTFDREVAEPNAQKLLNAAVAKCIRKDLGKATTAWVGRGFIPLSKASAHLSSITSEPLYGFVDPMIEAVVTSMGAQFVPTDAPPMYRQGLIGHFHGADYRAQRFLKSVTIPEALVTAIGTTGKFNTYTSGTSYDTIKIDFGTAAASAFTVQAGSVFWIDGVMACDTVGDPASSAQYAFIVLEDVAVASGDTDVTIKVDPVTFDLGGTRDACKEDGSSWTAATLANALVTVPEAGKYYSGYVRANGAMEFETLDKLDVSNADSESGKVEGITIHKNRVIDLANFENITRFDIVELSGIVEKRANTYILVK